MSTPLRRFLATATLAFSIGFGGLFVTGCADSLTSDLETSLASDSGEMGKVIERYGPLPVSDGSFTDGTTATSDSTAAWSSGWFGKVIERDRQPGGGTDAFSEPVPSDSTVTSPPDKKK